MNTEQLTRYLAALEAIAINTARIAAALEGRPGLLERLFPASEAVNTPTDLNPKGPYA